MSSIDLAAILAAFPALAPYVPVIIAVAAILASLLPAPAAATGGAYALLYRLVNLLGANVGHARNASDPAAGGTLKTIMMILLLPAMLALAACDSPGSRAALAVACQIDAAAQPVAVQIAPALAPQLAGVAAIDQQLVHPVVVAACAAMGGKPVPAQ